MKQTQGFSLLLCFILSMHTLTAQIVHTPQINGEHLEAYSNKWHMYSVDAQGQEKLLTIWTDYTQLIELDGTLYMNRTQELYNPDMSLRELWTNLFEQRSLLPYKAAQFKTNGDHLYTSFEPRQVSISLKTGNSQPSQQQFDMTSPYWDWTLYGILLSGLPFEAGKTYTIPVFFQQNATGQGNIIATVEREEMIKDDDQNVHNTWKVTTNTGLTFWLTKEAPYVIQLTAPAQNSGYIIWRMFK